MAAGLRGEAAPDLPADVTTEMSACAPRSSCLAILLLVLSACGLKGDEKEAAEALSAALQKEYTGLSAGDADCVAEHWVKDIGLAGLRKADLIGDNNTVVGDVRDTELSESNANEAVDAFDDCTVFRKLAVGMVTTLFASDESQSACIDKAVTDEAAHAWALSDLQGQVTDNVFVVGGRGCMATDEENARAVQSLKGSFGDADGIGKGQAGCVAQGLVETIGTYELTSRRRPRREAGHLRTAEGHAPQCHRREPRCRRHRRLRERRGHADRLDGRRRR